VLVSLTVVAAGRPGRHRSINSIAATMDLRTRSNSDSVAAAVRMAGGMRRSAAERCSAESVVRGVWLLDGRALLFLREWQASERQRAVVLRGARIEALAHVLQAAPGW
jgi:hypothetical protein